MATLAPAIRARRGGVLAVALLTFWCVLAVALLTLWCASAAGPARADDRTGPPTKRILVLQTERADLPATASVDRGIRSTLAARAGEPVELFAEYLDIARFSEARRTERYAESLHYRYAEMMPDVLIAIGAEAVDFLVRRGAMLYPGTPVVVAGLEERHLRARPLPAGFTGVVMSIQTRGTLELALRLHPGTRRVAIVAGATPFSRYWAAETRRVAEELSLEAVDLVGLTMQATLDAVAAQPPHTVIFYTHILSDGAGQRFAPSDALAAIASAARAPIYGAYETYVGRGIVGGSVLLLEREGIRAAQIALRILSGERPDSIPLEPSGSSAYQVDWRQLRRWGLDERRLPAGTTVLFRQPSVWELYGWHLVGGVALVLAQSALIAGLLVQRARRRRAERALAERLRFEALLSELSAAFRTVPAPTLDGEIGRGLRRIVEELDLDRATMVELDTVPGAVRVTASWVRAGTEPVPARVDGAAFPWIRTRLLERQTVRVTRLAELPEAAAADRAALQALGTRSFVAVPLSLNGAVVGALSFASLRAERDWPEDLVARLRTLEETFALALARRRADSAIRESEERFALMADNAPVMVWLAGPDGRRTYFNARWLEFTGRRFEAERGDGWLAGVDPDDRGACRAALAAAQDAGRPVTIEYRLQGADGAPRRVLDHAVPRRGPDGSFSGYVGTCIDVGELRAAQQALAEGAALRSAIFGALDGNVVALDGNGIIIAVNQSWSDFARDNGVDPAQVSVGADYLAVCRAAAGLGDDDGRHALALIGGALGVRGTAARLEYACPSPSGERWYEMSVEPLRRPEGGALVSHVDITRRRQAEEAARRRAEELAHVQRVGVLGDLAGGLAHEINQPLAAIVADAQATSRLLDRIGSPPAEAIAALGDIADDARRAAKVIARLRALFRREPAERGPVSVDGLVREVAELLHGELRRKGVAIETAVDADLPSVVGDAVQLQQVVLNVLMNAAEAVAAADPGPREIRVAARACTPDRVEISVCDTGVGVGEGDLERIFARFFTTKRDGLGMGLSISRSILEGHGGRIWAERNPGRGITVRLELPCDDAAPAR